MPGVLDDRDAGAGRDAAAGARRRRQAVGPCLPARRRRCEVPAAGGAGRSAAARSDARRRGARTLARAHAVASIGDSVVAEAELVMALVPDASMRAASRPGVTIDPTRDRPRRARSSAPAPSSDRTPSSASTSGSAATAASAPRAVVDGWTEIGDGNEIFPFASIGLIPQDLKFRGETTRLSIGHRNVFREFVTIHRGTAGGGGADRHRRPQRVHGLRARRARLPRRATRRSSATPRRSAGT